MRIRHVVAQDNIDESGVIRDPRRVCHCVVVAGRIADISGEVDPATHLNRDCPTHQLGPCIVAERLERGAAVLYDDERFLFAKPSPEDLVSLGPVDLDRRRIDWLAAYRLRGIGRR
jgi:hypothetical protein